MMNRHNDQESFNLFINDCFSILILSGRFIAYAHGIYL